MKRWAKKAPVLLRIPLPIQRRYHRLKVWRQLEPPAVRVVAVCYQQQPHPLGRLGLKRCVKRTDIVPHVRKVALVVLVVPSLLSGTPNAVLQRDGHIAPPFGDVQDVDSPDIGLGNISSGVAHSHLHAYRLGVRSHAAIVAFKACLVCELVDEQAVGAVPVPVLVRVCL